MAEPFVAEIRIMATNFAPRGWAFCNGQLLPISQNTALFSLVGTTYGGDGRTSFGLPDLQGRAPMHPGQGPGLSPHSLGQKSGAETATLVASAMPSHSHAASGYNGPGTGTSPAGRIWATLPGRTPPPLYDSAPTGYSPMSAQALAPAGGDQPHNNMQPFLTINFVIALQGIYPSRS